MTTPLLTTPLLTTSELRHRRGDFVMSIDRLHVARGEVVGVIGPIGAGKTTLLRLLSGVDAPDVGRIAIEGETISPDAPLDRRRRVVMVHQQPALLTGTVRYNVAYGLRIRGGTGIDDDVRSVLAQLDLVDVAEHRVAELSGGQRQLVAVARALVVRPDLLILDEPTSHLDPARVALVERVVLTDRAERGTSVVWATHNHFQARRAADRTALLLDGSLVEVNETERFFESPDDPRTADFVAGRTVY